MHFMAMLSIQYSVHTPSLFLSKHWEQLLPDWRVPVAAVLVLLQECPTNLLEKTMYSEQQKQILRERFLEVGLAIATQLEARGYQAEMFDPRSGLPLRSRPGSLQLDDVAVVQAVLDYPATCQGGCLLIHHPDWGSAVYPSILVSSAHPSILSAVAQAVIPAASQNSSTCSQPMAWVQSS